MNATYDNGNNFNTKLRDTLQGLLNANKDRKDEIDALRGDHEELKKNFEDFQTSAERENDLRKNEIRSLEDKQQKDNQVWTLLGRHHVQHAVKYEHLQISPSIIVPRLVLQFMMTFLTVSPGSRCGHCQIGGKTGR